jgi:proteic killer suppression protein
VPGSATPVRTFLPALLRCRPFLLKRNGSRYYCSVIQSFADTVTEKIWSRERVRGVGPDVHRQTHRKLVQLNVAAVLDDLRVPPGNRLEKLKGDRAGAYSIRVNDQFRICFVWTGNGPANVQLVDYH